MGRLKQDKAAMHRTLAAAGLPLPPPSADFAAPLEWQGGGPLGLPALLPSGLPHPATPASMLSAFSVPFAVQPNLGPGFKPGPQEHPLSLGAYLLATSGPPNGPARVGSSHGLPHTTANGAGQSHQPASQPLSPELCDATA